MADAKIYITCKLQYIYKCRANYFSSNKTNCFPSNLQISPPYLLRDYSLTQCLDDMKLLRPDGNYCIYMSHDRIFQIGLIQFIRLISCMPVHKYIFFCNSLHHLNKEFFLCSILFHLRSNFHH